MLNSGVCKTPMYVLLVICLSTHTVHTHTEVYVYSVCIIMCMNVQSEAYSSMQPVVWPPKFERNL